MFSKFKLPSIHLRNKYNLFIIFLISYLAILIVPILIGSLSYIQSSRVLKEQIGNSNISMLEQSAQIIDGYLYSIDQLLSNMALDPQIQNFLYARKPLTQDNLYGMYKAMEQISTFKSSNSIVDNLYVYFKYSNAIISYSGKYEPDFFYHQFIPYRDDSYSSWKSALEEICYKQYAPVKLIPEATPPAKLLTCRQSLPLGEKQHSLGIAVVSIDAGKVENLLKNIDMFSHAEVYMLDSSDNIIMSIGNNRYGKPELLSSKVSSSQQYVNYIGREEVLVSRVPSRYNHWEYISIIPTRAFMSKVNNIKKLTVLIIAIELLIGFLLSFRLARKNYLPIKRVMDKLERITGNQLHTHGNELVFIEEITNATFTENEKIKETMSRQQPIIRANTLTHLLYGNINEYKNLHESLRSFGIFFESDTFVILTIHIDDCSNFAKDASLDQIAIIRYVIINAAEELLHQEYTAYSVEMNLNDIAIIVGAAKNSTLNLDNIYSLSNKLNEFMAEKFSTLITIGIGSFREGITGISQSYQESVKAAEYKIIRGQGSVIAFEDISHVNKSYTYPTAAEEKLINHIKIGDTAKVLSLLDDVFIKSFKNSNISVEIARCLFFDIMSTALKVLDDVDIDYASVFEKDSNPLNKILSCQTADEMHTTLKILFKTICEFIHQNKKSHNQDLKDGILDYLNQKYSDGTLSLTTVADALNINSSYLSYFFKKQTGVNFVDYLNKVRIEKSMELLAGTSLSLSEIAEKVGYSNYSSLIRIFKKMNGITPGNYREHLSQKPHAPVD